MTFCVFCTSVREPHLRNHCKTICVYVYVYYMYNSLIYQFQHQL